MDLIAALRSFVRVAQTGSFSAVAQERGLTQPAISRQVSALEQALGVRLVHRTTQAVSLTEDGRHLLEPARQTLAEVDRLIQTVGGQRGQAVGRVRVAMPASLAFHVVAQMDRLTARHPGLSIDLIVREGASRPIEEGLDLEIRLGQPDDPSLVSTIIGLTQAHVVASPAYLASRGTPRHPRELGAHNCLFFHRHGAEDTWWFRDATHPDRVVEDDFAVAVRGNLRSNSAEAIYRSVMRDQGIALLGHLMVTEDIKEGRLVALFPDHPNRRYPICALYPSQGVIPPRTRVMLDFVTELVMADPAMAPLQSLASPDGSENE